MQEPVQQPDAAAPSSDTAQTTAPSDAFDVDALFGAAPPAAVEAPAPAIALEEGDEPEPEPDDAATDEPKEDEQAPTDEVPAVPEEQRIFDLASIVAQNPNRIEEVPRKDRPAVLQQLLAAAAFRGRAEAEQAFEQRSSNEEAARRYVAERDEFARTSPDEFRTWEQEKPDEAERYWGAKRYFNQKAAPPPEAQSALSPEVIQQRAEVKLGRLRALPEAQRNALTARVNAGEFKLTEAGLDALEEALFQAATASTAAAPPAPSPAQAQATRRQAAAATREALPKPVGLGGSGADAPVASYDPDELFAAAASQSAGR